MPSMRPSLRPNAILPARQRTKARRPLGRSSVLCHQPARSRHHGRGSRPRTDRQDPVIGWGGEIWIETHDGRRIDVDQPVQESAEDNQPVIATLDDQTWYIVKPIVRPAEGRMWFVSIRVPCFPVPVVVREGATGCSSESTRLELSAVPRSIRAATAAATSSSKQQPRLSSQARRLLRR
jgi:hypothetical protein